MTAVFMMTVTDDVAAELNMVSISALGRCFQNSMSAVRMPMRRHITISSSVRLKIKSTRASGIMEIIP